MEIKVLEQDFTVCQVADYSQVNLAAEFCFTGKTDEEYSLVCVTGDVPANVIRRDDGWKGLPHSGRSGLLAGGNPRQNHGPSGREQHPNLRYFHLQHRLCSNKSRAL